MKPPVPQSAIRHPLNAILGSETHVRILRELFRYSGEMSAVRIAREAKLSPYGTRLALAALTSTGMAKSLGSGRSILYGIDREHSLSGALEALFRAERKREEDILAAVKAATDDGAIDAAWLYGSFARHEDKVGSDLDIVLVASSSYLGAVDRARLRLIEAGERMMFAPSIVGLDHLDVRRLSTEEDPWWRNVAKEAVVVRGSRPEKLAAQIIGQITGRKP